MAIKNLNPQGILAQISNVVSKQLYKAIKYLLYPCCVVDNITGVDFTALSVAGVDVRSQDITILILSSEGNKVVGKAVVAIDGSGNGSI